MLHFCILTALTDLSMHDEAKPHIGDVRLSTVLEPGKARIITVSRVEHSIVLHPLAHLLSTLIGSLPSSKTGMKASNHMWDTYVRIKKVNISEDGMYSGVTSFLASEDWKEATDSINPYVIKLILEGLIRGLELPRFYARLCKILLTMPRRVYERDILKSENYLQPFCVKTLGIFQGDPLCKQMLHMSHLVPRKVGLNWLKRVGRKAHFSEAHSRQDKAGNWYGGITNLNLVRRRTSEKVFRQEVRRTISPPKHDLPLDWKRGILLGQLDQIQRIE